ncbi:exonuclease domain-containing protein [Streptomyces niveiscabiei]|uniref:exonuclease domain-containing protein n=1 Tax=Streptomyces niveiscabiei TaxID=164115 RepID=UPI0038F62321
MSTTRAAVTEQIPSSRTEPDPSRVAKGKPRGHIDDVPVYGWGQAPPYLRTQTQLGEERLKLAKGQPVLAYIETRKYGDIPLYDPAGAEKMRPLPSSTKARMAKRRTCPECGKVRDRIAHGKRCSVCWDKARAEQQRRDARTCWDCQEVSERRLPSHHRCGGCRRKQLDKRRQDAVVWVEKVTVCPGDGYDAGCSVKLVTKKEARAYQKGQGAERTWWSRAPHWPTRCPPCTEANERRDAEERAKYQAEYERREKERREAEHLAAEQRERWAAVALVDPDVLVLDTETTGLDDDARIVELAVLNSHREVLLDTLLQPGVPVPDSAADIHGITTEALVGAPTFSDILVQLAGLLIGKRCLIYNKWFDLARLRHELTLHYLDCTGWLESESREERVTKAAKLADVWLDRAEFEDVMIPYSDWVGDWNEYYGNNTWQPLNGGHRAAGDCRAVLDCLRAMGREYADEYATAAVVAGGTNETTVTVEREESAAWSSGTRTRENGALPRRQLRRQLPPGG